MYPEAAPLLLSRQAVIRLSEGFYDRLNFGSRHADTAIDDRNFQLTGFQVLEGNRYNPG